MLMTRRKLLQSSMFAASFPFIERCSRLVGSAQTTAASDYKALVCVFLFGGNDANNLLVPTDQMNYGLYANARGQLALPQSQLLQLPGTSLAFIRVCQRSNRSFQREIWPSLPTQDL